MGFVIKLTHREGKPPRYVCPVPMTPHEIETAKMEMEGLLVDDDVPEGTVIDTVVETLEEARRYPYQTAEEAAYAVAEFPATKHISYEVIAVEETDAASTGGR